MKQQEWQKGIESKLNPLQRLELHSDWLNNIHKELKMKLTSKVEIEDTNEIKGFIDIDKTSSD